MKVALEVLSRIEA